MYTCSFSSLHSCYEPKHTRMRTYKNHLAAYIFSPTLRCLADYCTDPSHIMSRSRSRLRSRSITHRGSLWYIQPCTYVPLQYYRDATLPILRYQSRTAYHLRTWLPGCADRLHIYIFLRRLRLLVRRRCSFRATCHSNITKMTCVGKFMHALVYSSALCKCRGMTTTEVCKKIEISKLTFILQWKRSTGHLSSKEKHNLKDACGE